jgi:hypothetical protein
VLPCSFKEACSLTLDLDFLTITKPNVKRMTILEEMIPSEMRILYIVSKSPLVCILSASAQVESQELQRVIVSPSTVGNY